MSADYDPRAREAARERVSLPAVFLVVVGAINVLLSGWTIWGGIHELLRNDEARRAEIREQRAKMPPDQLRAMDQIGLTEETLVTIGRLQGPIGVGVGTVALLASCLAVLGGLRMIKLRSHGLALAAAILTSIPIISPCCCFGQVVGIWALVILLNQDVQAAFVANSPPPPEGGPMSSSPFPS